MALLRSRRWMFTHITEASPPYAGLEGFSYLCAAEEFCPTTGRRHFQGYCVTAVRTTRSGVSKLFAGFSTEFGNVHVGDAKGWFCQGTHEECIKYCQGPYEKEGKSKPLNPTFKVFIDKGYQPEGGTNKRDRWAATLDSAKSGRFEDIDADIQITQFGNLRKVHAEAITAADLGSVCGVWISGLPGTGKSQLAREGWKEEFPDSTLYDKQPIKFWDNYRGQEIALLEDLDPRICPTANLDYYLKIWADKYAFQGEVKYGHTGKIRPKLFIVTSQYRIHQCFRDPDTYTALQRRFVELECWKVPEIPEPGVPTVYRRRMFPGQGTVPYAVTFSGHGEQIRMVRTFSSAPPAVHSTSSSSSAIQVVDRTIVPGDFVLPDAPLDLDFLDEAPLPEEVSEEWNEMMEAEWLAGFSAEVKY